MWDMVCDCVSEEKGKEGGNGGRRDETIYKDGRREIYNKCWKEVLSIVA